MATATEVKTPAQRFHSNLLELCDLATDIVSWVKAQGASTSLDPLLMSMAKGVIGGWTPAVAAEGFIKRSANYWESIRAKDRTFLVANASVLFNELPADSVRAFSALFELRKPRELPLPTEGTPLPDEELLLPKETLDSVWDLLHAMVRTCIRHIHETRVPKPTLVTVGGVTTTQTKYTVDYFPSLKVKDLVTKWDVRL